MGQNVEQHFLHVAWQALSRLGEAVVVNRTQ